MYNSVLFLIEIFAKWLLADVIFKNLKIPPLVIGFEPKTSGLSGQCLNHSTNLTSDS